MYLVDLWTRDRKNYIAPEVAGDILLALLRGDAANQLLGVLRGELALADGAYASVPDAVACFESNWPFPRPTPLHAA